LKNKSSKYYLKRKKQSRLSRRLYRLKLILLWLGIGALAIPMISTGYINLVTMSDRYRASAQIPHEDVAIVLGAGLSADGIPSPMLADRVESAVELYQHGRIHKLLMTGDNSAISYNEVVAMKRFAHDLGVPTQDITLDYAGFSTYESCYRAHQVFDVHRAVVITQRYHLPRAVYTCRQLGVKAVGLGTADREIYGLRGMIPYLLREMLANVKALSEIYLTRPHPTFL
jgi:vancomycin permeability regulator SanA